MSLSDKSEFEWLVASDQWLVNDEILADFFDLIGREALELLPFPLNQTNPVGICSTTSH